jgi:EAL domain-containing protein (putative c-di-GMP-specific phosphodiesterase class I)
MQPFTIKAHEFTVTSSIGISVFPRDGEDAVTLLKNADAAMYNSKKLGRNRAQFFLQGMNSPSLDILTMEQLLRQAVNRDELELYYQPQINFKNGRIVTVEALLRWRHPHKGLISPAEFIPIAEETGSILSIGRWVLNQACKQVQHWHESGYSKLRVAVNISIQQFEQDDLIKSVSTALASAGLAGKYLELEITESQSLSDIEGTIGILQAIKTQGVKWAIDDFGTGYSSLSYLKQLPVDVLKIDKSFIHGISENSCDSGIVSSIISIGHVLNLEVIAEGIETQAQLAMLKSQSCDGFQGFYYSPPLPVDDMSRLLHNNYGQTIH